MQRVASWGVWSLLLLWGTWLQAQAGGATLVFALTCGVALGVAFQRSRFCFYCHARDWFENRDPRGMLAIVLAVAIGLIGYTAVLGGWIVNPAAGRLPPDIHIGPVSWVLLLAGAAFGLGMVVSGSCISAHWYRLSEGSTVSPFALIGTAMGFVVGFKSWNGLYSLAIADAPVVWLPAHLGYGGALVVQLAVLVAVVVYLWRGFASPLYQQKVANAQLGQQVDHHKQAQATQGRISAAASVPNLHQVWAQLWQGRWPYWTGGLVVGLVGVLAIIRMKPLGVTAFLGTASRQWADAQGWIPATMHGLDGFAGCSTTPQSTWLMPNAVLLTGIVGGAFAAAFLSRQFVFKIPGARDVVRGLSGGLLLGWGAMVGLGCTVGTLLSGSQAGAVSGWVFGAAMFATIGLALKIKARWL
ncbi:YeeE/YedE family protein [Lampropedia puyangensis]|uniref:YeeE/YedE family protein n=1 Tax=Lampropedia puyangensis TaxID=1330072 RepID=A0A4S8F6E5_9BURK|nr:YeeE/YedE thiosulfate transporter family protein [Lampropedia puyangensis]THU02481.1 YeeE/YedE family protein [Lampropedia puyangensis]